MRNGVLSRVVVDTNLFISALISKRGAPYRLLLALRDGRFLLLLSDIQQRELTDVVSRPGLLPRYEVHQSEIDDLLAFIAANSVPVPDVRADLLPVHVRDPKDEIILASALAGNADYLVTGDNDLLVLAGDPRLGGLRIVTASEFLAVVTRGA
jgi:putative PIN family toxin of toxin-antitoxin system